jgi:hypothetical protein
MTINHEYSVKIDHHVYNRMFAHARFLARVSVSAAERLYTVLRETIDELSYNPEVYPVYMPKKPIDAVLHYKLCDKRYRVVYEIIGNMVYVYDIQDCRQDTDRNLV